MRTLIDEVKLFTGEAFFDNACVQVDDARIVYAGPRGDAPAFVGERIIDGKNKLVMPGLVNGHTHLAMTLLRGLGSDLPLHQWLREAIFPLEAGLTRESVMAGTRLAVMESLRFGVTTVLDMYMYESGVAQVLAESGMRALVGQSQQLEEPGASRREIIALHREWHEQAQGRIRVSVACHAEYTSTEAALRDQIELARELEIPIHVHVSETEEEVLGCRQRHNGLSPVQYLDSLGMFTAPAILAHCVHVDAQDMDILMQRPVHVIHNPVSNLKLASGFMPLLPMIARGIRVGLGTDGVASNNNLNLWEEVKLTGILHKGATRDATAVSPMTVLDMATRIGAEALGYPNVGLLKSGWHADLILLDTSGAHWTPTYDPAAQLVYGAQGSDVYLTMVDGNILYEDGKFNTLDAEKTKREALTASQGLLSKANKAQTTAD